MQSFKSKITFQNIPKHLLKNIVIVHIWDRVSHGNGHVALETSKHYISLVGNNKFYTKAEDYISCRRAPDIRIPLFNMNVATINVYYEFLLEKKNIKWSKYARIFNSIGRESYNCFTLTTFLLRIGIIKEAVNSEFELPVMIFSYLTVFSVAILLLSGVTTHEGRLSMAEDIKKLFSKDFLHKNLKNFMREIGKKLEEYRQYITEDPKNNMRSIALRYYQNYHAKIIKAILKMNVNEPYFKWFPYLFEKHSNEFYAIKLMKLIDEDLKMFKSKFISGYEFNEDVWVLTLYNSGAKTGGHSMLFVEGVIQHKNHGEDRLNSLFVAQFDIRAVILNKKNKKNNSFICRYFNSVDTELNPVGYITEVFIIDSVSGAYPGSLPNSHPWSKLDGNDFKRLYLNKDYRQYTSVSWYVKPECVKAMIESIEFDLQHVLKAKRGETKFAKYQMLGHGRSNKTQGMNCTDWSEEKLAIARGNKVRKLVGDSASVAPEIHANPNVNKSYETQEDITQSTAGLHRANL